MFVDCREIPWKIPCRHIRNMQTAHWETLPRSGTKAHAAIITQPQCHPLVVLKQPCSITSQHFRLNTEVRFIAQDKYTLWERGFILCYQTHRVGTFSELTCFMRLSWHFRLKRRHETLRRNWTIPSFPTACFCSSGPVVIHTKEASEREQSRRWKARDMESDRLVKRENSEPLHAMRYHMTSKAGLWLKKPAKGVEAWWGGRAEVCKSELLLAQSGLFRPECSLPMSCGKIVFCMCF